MCATVSTFIKINFREKIIFVIACTVPWHTEQSSTKRKEGLFVMKRQKKRLELALNELLPGKIFLESCLL